MLRVAATPLQVLEALEPGGRSLPGAMASIDASAPGGAGAPNVNAWAAVWRDGLIEPAAVANHFVLTELGRTVLARLREVGAT